MDASHEPRVPMRIAYQQVKVLGCPTWCPCGPFRKAHRDLAQDLVNGTCYNQNPVAFHFFDASILVPFSGFHFWSTIHWLSKHQIWSVPWGVPKLQGSNLVFFWPGWWKFSVSVKSGAAVRGMGDSPYKYNDINDMHSKSGGLKW